MPERGESSFLTAGIKHFPDAHATVAAFRRLVTALVTQILKSRPDVWKPKQQIKQTHGEATGLWVGAGGWMTLESDSSKQLNIDVGIKWSPPYFDERVVAQVVIYSATELMGAKPQAEDQVVNVVFKGRDAWFATSLEGDSPDVEAALRRVTDAAASAVLEAIKLKALPVQTTQVTTSPLGE